MTSQRRGRASDSSEWGPARSRPAPAVPYVFAKRTLATRRPTRDQDVRFHDIHSLGAHYRKCPQGLPNASCIGVPLWYGGLGLGFDRL